MDDGRSVLETGRAERSVWLMKCPPLVSRSWKSAAASADPSNPNPAVGKVVLSLDPLRPDDPSSLQAISLSPHSPPSRSFIRVDFPGWEDGDPIGCISRVERYFHFHKTPDASMVDIVAIHLEGDAIQWYD
ncbi:hypothetical protein B296_00053164 [Ensete ventricosum]|uniref:Uncharacterized protein n=1 Tax=Ensete ventricosum TaxID=4639 RepID=A0A426Y9G5_ENSVE|nr:hypothetical protein B296_00053164 [Ensete ventricosum]